MREEAFYLPDLGEGLTEAEILRWLVAEGDTVTVDQPVTEVETTKSAIEVPTPFAGTITALHAAEGDTVAVGAPLLSIDTASSPATEDSHASTRVTDSYTTDGAATDGERHRAEERASSGNVLIGYGTPTFTEDSGRRRRRRSQTAPPSPAPVQPFAQQPAAPLVSSPLVRQLARRNNLDINSITGSGRNGVITRRDVERSLQHSAPAAADGVNAPPLIAAEHPVPQTGECRIPLTGFRKAVAATLSHSRSEIPEATVWVDVDATPLVELRESTRIPQDPGPGLLAYLARFTVAALKDYPVLNAQLDTQRQEIVEYDWINLGIAVHTDRGLIVPAVTGAEHMSATRLDTEIRNVTDSARKGHTRAQQLAAGTFTLNNYGSFRVDGSAAIINHPQVAILGFGRIIDRPWVIDGQLCARKITQMSLVFDHRVCDGGTAAGFMRHIADSIENPATAIARL